MLLVMGLYLTYIHSCNSQVIWDTVSCILLEIKYYCEKTVYHQLSELRLSLELTAKFNMSERKIWVQTPTEVGQRLVQTITHNTHTHMKKSVWLTRTTSPTRDFGRGGLKVHHAVHSVRYMERHKRCTRSVTRSTSWYTTISPVNILCSVMKGN